jgi:hypothetical protein
MVSHVRVARVGIVDLEREVRASVPASIMRPLYMRAEQVMF